jgi:hypothetical protein
MTDETARLYVSIDRSGLTPRYIASPHMHPGAAVWVPRDLLTEAVQWGFISAAPGDWRVSDIRRVADAILAALPAPPGAQEEGE